MVVIPINPLGKLRHKDSYEFDASLDYLEETLQTFKNPKKHERPDGLVGKTLTVHMRTTVWISSTHI